jgi:hypothetical protein
MVDKTLQELGRDTILMLENNSPHEVHAFKFTGPFTDVERQILDTQADTIRTEYGGSHHDWRVTMTDGRVFYCYCESHRTQQAMMNFLNDKFPNDIILTVEPRLM